MTAARSHTLPNCLVISFSAVVLFTATAPTASAQTPPDLFTRVETLTKSDGTPAFGPARLAGDIAVIGGNGTVVVFERDPGGITWVDTAALAPSDGAAGFGASVATDGRTIAAPASGAVYVFQRALGGRAWQEVAKLAGDTNVTSFGSSVSVSGTTIVVGAPFPDVAGGERGPGVVYVFEQDEGGPGAWGETARVTGMSHPRPGLIDSFGTTISIDADTLLVGALAPTGVLGDNRTVLAYIFSRNVGGPDWWGLVVTLNPGLGVDRVDLSASLNGDTAAVGFSGSIGGPLRIFERDRGGSNAWGEAAMLGTFFSGVPGSIILSGNLLLAAYNASSGLPARTAIFSRDQGGKGRWGEAFRTTLGPFRALSGDTAFLPGAAAGTLDVYVVDTDRDGLRDGIDACPRDPLNNVEGGCTRTSAAYLVLDDLIALGDVATETRGDEFHVTATFTNASDRAVGNPFFEITDLTGGNLLVNSDAGPGGPGATLSPDVGDGILSPGESTTVTFVIGLATHEAFSFYVSVRGDAGP